jgi:hypothetical protein
MGVKIRCKNTLEGDSGGSLFKERIKRRRGQTLMMKAGLREK